jgi:hypothetical protein
MTPDIIFLHYSNISEAERQTALFALQAKKNFLLRSLKILPSLIEKTVNPF